MHAITGQGVCVIVSAGQYAKSAGLLCTLCPAAFSGRPAEFPTFAREVQSRMPSSLAQASFAQEVGSIDQRNGHWNA
jgi:hypothetical protein